LAARRLDGKALAQQLRAGIAEEAARLTTDLGRPPGLTVVLVGEDPASQVYVKNKARAAREAGIRDELLRLPASTTQAELLDTIARLNADETVDGILVQLPLPKGINDQAVIEALDPLKDVDGFHPENTGLLAQGKPRFVPCTPLGVVELVRESGLDIAGQRAVVVGRSNIVGKPMALLLLRKGPGGDATVTVCHSASRGIEAIAREADLLVVAMGRPEAVGPDWIKPGAVVIDVGIHRRPDGSLCGDVQTEAVSEIASAITPVPGGVGPMTVVMLLKNTVQSARLRAELIRGQGHP
jgi:methylenetetrahydrofolate dehydrogenase (NADP+)/methenyltetrahydrofolate cyclohydrolase